MKPRIRHLNFQRISSFSRQASSKHKEPILHTLLGEFSSETSITATDEDGTIVRRASFGYQFEYVPDQKIMKIVVWGEGI